MSERTLRGGGAAIGGGILSEVKPEPPKDPPVPNPTPNPHDPLGGPKRPKPILVLKPTKKPLVKP